MVTVVLVVVVGEVLGLVAVVVDVAGMVGNQVIGSVRGKFYYNNSS